MQDKKVFDFGRVTVKFDDFIDHIQEAQQEAEAAFMAQMMRLIDKEILDSVPSYTTDVWFSLDKKIETELQLPSKSDEKIESPPGRRKIIL